MKKLVLITITLLVVIFLTMGGTSIVESRIARWTTDFNTLSSDSRILYENGAEKIALEAAKHLSNAMKNVEAKQYGKFKEPSTIYVFASPTSFSKFSGISDKARGASVGNEIYLSGLLLDMPDEVYGMIGHELSHVQFSQTLGIIDFNRTLPRWFREGLAIYASDGGGAPRNYEAETRAMFIKGEHFIPESTGALLNRTLTSTASISPRMFYSQSGLFVKYLANTYPQKFKDLLTGLQEGKHFKEYFEKSFNTSINDILASYITKLKKG